MAEQTESDDLLLDEDPLMERAGLGKEVWASLAVAMRLSHGCVPNPSYRLLGSWWTSQPSGNSRADNHRY